MYRKNLIISYHYHRSDIEAFIWISALIFFALIHPDENSGFTICPFHLLGFQYCPGCGLGHSISFLLHGKVVPSIDAHPLGIFALPVLIFRIYRLLKLSVKLSVNRIENQSQGLLIAKK
ncbi:MAG: DUF2752 domain-containing protein [Bacteroidia bacterium]|nr:DUF2752 domain-containing protein [Bacteroidia bacterium]